MYIERIFCALSICLLAPFTAAEEREYRYSDAHLHYVDFFQETDGMQKLLEAMDAGHIDHVMISGIPVAKKWHENEPKRPRYYAGDDAPVYWYSATDVLVAAALEELDEEQRKRFHPFLSGFNPNDKNADAHIRRMLELHPGLWQGLGEIFTRHDDVTALTEGDTPRANNEALAELYTPLHPAVIRLVRDVIRLAHARGKSVAVCGEMAGDPAFTPLLLALGLLCIALCLHGLDALAVCIALCLGHGCVGLAAPGL